METSKAPARALLLLIAATPLVALFLLKWPSAMATLKSVAGSGIYHAKAELIAAESLSPALRPLARTLSYLYTVRWALFYGVLISATVRAFLSPQWVGRLLGQGRMKGQLLGGALGAPLMLCSCCVAPVAVTAFQRTGRLGPAMGLLLAAPSLNPAALALTFVLFPMSVGLARLAMAVVMVFAGSAVVASFHPDQGHLVQTYAEESPRLDSPGRILGAFLHSVRKTAWQTLPLVALGVLFSMTLLQIFPLENLTETSLRAFSILAVAALAIPMALPTFLEFPLALTLMSINAPLGAVAALLFAGPALNLPSLLTLGRAAGARVALSLALAVFVVALAGGLALG